MSAQRASKVRASPRTPRLLVETSRVLPMVDIEIAMPVGSLQDPPGKEGLAQLTGALMRRGPRGLSPERFEERLARLGARMSIDVEMRSTRVRATVVRRHLDSLLTLVAETLFQPALRASDFAQLKRQARAALVSSLDDDQTLGAGCLRQKLFEGHPYGRRLGGDTSSLRRIALKDTKTFYCRYLTQVPFVVGAAGDVADDELDTLIRKRFPRPTEKKRNGKVTVPAPRMPKGRQVIIIDKPDRVQTQLFIGTLGIRTRDRRLFPLLVSNTAFGGMFSSKLMQEVRAARGWSYGAFSRLSHADQRDAWYMWTAPSSDYSAECAKLQIELLEHWVERGVSRTDLTFAKNYLVNSHCFDRDTPSKRLEARIDIEVLGLPRSYVYAYPERIRRVTHQDAKEATAALISSRDLTIVVVASAPKVEAAFGRLPDVADVQIVPFESFRS